MSTVYLLVGIPGSGKSTYSKTLTEKHNAIIVSSDVIRTLHPDWPEEDIFPEVYRLTGQYLLENKNVIYDATNITPKVRKRAIDKIKEYIKEFDVAVYYFPMDWHVCYSRIEKRNQNPNERFLPLEIIESYSQKIIEPTLEEGFQFIEVIKQGQEVTN